MRLTGPWAPTEKQVAFYVTLADHAVFTPEERANAMRWLEVTGTRQTIDAQIRRLRDTIQQRRRGLAQAARN